MKKAHHFYCELYKENFYFLCTPNIKNVQFYWSDFDADEQTKGRCFELSNDKCSGIFIWIKSTDQSGLGALVHESIHAANFLLESRGVETDRGNDENLAYYAQWIFEQCHKRMRKIKHVST